MYGSAEEGTESESIPWSPVSQFVEGPPGSSRSVSSSQALSSSRQRQIDTLEVQLAVKDSEIHRLADVFSGTEWALAEREKEARHLSALVDNLEQQIAAKNEVLDLSQELIGSLEERLVALEVQKDAFEARAGEYQQSVIGLQLEVERLSADLLSLRHETVVNTARNQELEGLVRSLEGRLREESRNNAAKLLDGERQAAEKVKGLNQKICRLQKRLLETAEVLRVSAETVGGLKRQLQEKDRALKENKAEVEKALLAQAKVLRGAEMRIAVLEQEVLRKAGNLEAVEVHVAYLQRQLEEKESDCAQSRESVTGLLLQLEAEGESARSLQGELEKERQRRLQVEKELQEKNVELKLNGAMIARLRRETAVDRPLEPSALRADVAALPSADLAESVSSRADSQGSESSFGGVENTDSRQSASSVGSASCEDSDAESIAQTSRGDILDGRNPPLNIVQGEDILSGPSLVSFLEETAKYAQCGMGAEEGGLIFSEKEASSSGAIGLLACGLLDLGGRQTSLSTPEFGLESETNADTKGLSVIGIEVSISLKHVWLLEVEI
jgi:hypothetical protein